MRLQLAEIIVGFEAQFLHGSCEAEALLVRNRERGRVQHLTKGSVNRAAIECSNL
jgi:hypothetical protein